MARAEQLHPKYETKGDIPDWIVNEAHLINEALDKDTITQQEAETGLIEDREILEVMKGLIDIRYFVEYPPENLNGKDRGEALMELFTQKTSLHGREMSLAEYLAEKGQGVSLAMISLDDSTAKVVRYLNQTGVPVIGWVVVDDIEGYWTNPTNVAETREKTQAIRDWAEQNGLELEALGFDLEKPIEYMGALGKMNIVEIFRQIRKYRQKKREIRKHSDPNKDLQQLIDELGEDDVASEVYAMPNGLKGILGDMAIPTTTKGRGLVEMLYSSLYPGVIRRLIVPHLRTKGATPALGLVTGKEDETPGRDLTNGKLPEHLDTAGLQRDIARLLNQELNLGNRTISLRNLYLFALNDARVALMLDQAMSDAFAEHA